jgi:small subunit ribosomal protein S19e
MDADWWHVRAAAVLRSVGRLGPVGVSKLRGKYGGKKNRGHKPNQFQKGSGNIIRKVLQQLEAAKLIKQTKVGVHKGRVLTPEGHSLLDKAAVGIMKEQKTAKPAAKTAEPAAE